jgi:bifunctional ADP-heptose synthase (sugar kinase/adenylyltransferase)
MNSILVIGESCRDVFVYCDAIRLAPDYPVPILNIVNQAENPGMAANVHRNIVKYKGCDLFTNNNWKDITKTRYVHQNTNHMFIRVDSPSKIAEILLEDLNLDYELIVISDYNKGFLSQRDVEYICDHHPCVFLDTKKVLGKWASNARYIKINDYEYNNSKSFLTPEISNKIIHTMGGDGCEFQGKMYPVVNKAEVKDTSGAGDSFMAALCIKFLETKDIYESIKFANSCASEVVRHRGVTTI